MFQVGDIVQVIIVPKKYKQYDIAGATGVVKTVYSNNIRIHISNKTPISSATFLISTFSLLLNLR